MYERYRRALVSLRVNRPGIFVSALSADTQPFSVLCVAMAGDRAPGNAIDSSQHWQDQVFFIDVAVYLKREAMLKNMVDFFGLPHMPVFNLDLRRNKTPFIGPTIVTEQDKQEFKAVVRNFFPVVIKSYCRVSLTAIAVGSLK